MAKANQVHSQRHAALWPHTENALYSMQSPHAPRIMRIQHPHATRIVRMQHALCACNTHCAHETRRVQHAAERIRHRVSRTREDLERVGVAASLELAHRVGLALSFGGGLLLLPLLIVLLRAPARLHLCLGPCLPRTASYVARCAVELLRRGAATENRLGACLPPGPTPSDCSAHGRFVARFT